MKEAELLDWRRRVSDLYAAVRSGPHLADAHAVWRAGRDTLFSRHPQSPLRPADPLRASGLAYWPYDPGMRFVLPVLPSAPATLTLPTGLSTATTLHRIGHVALPEPLEADLDVWSLEQYGGGIFLPLRDQTSGDTTYGGGRYVLDTAKGADLGGDATALVVDLNFAYHPSCRYDSAWTCPLAPDGNTITVPVCVGERLAR